MSSSSFLVASFELSNIPKASCSQGTITHRIPLFSGEAIAKSGIGEKNPDAQASAGTQLPLRFGAGDDHRSLGGGLGGGFGLGCGSFAGGRSASGGSAGCEPSGGRFHGGGGGDDQAVPFLRFRPRQAVGGYDTAGGDTVTPGDVGQGFSGDDAVHAPGVAPLRGHQLQRGRQLIAGPLGAVQREAGGDGALQNRGVEGSQLSERRL